MMDWQQKLCAIQSLAGSGNVALHIRRPDDWYCLCKYVEIKEGSILRGGSGNGRSPAEAVENLWRELTELKPHEYVVVHAYSDDERRAVRWNGSMWEPRPETRAA